MEKITKDMLLADALLLGDTEKVEEVLYSYGMHCLGCALAHGETVEEAAMVHGIDPDEMVEALNSVLSNE